MLYRSHYTTLCNTIPYYILFDYILSYTCGERVGEKLIHVVTSPFEIDMDRKKERCFQIRKLLPLDPTSMISPLNNALVASISSSYTTHTRKHTHTHAHTRTHTHTGGERLSIIVFGHPYRHQGAYIFHSLAIL